jgi:hypothetical protein
MNETDTTFFTVEEANRTLPLVRRVVEDILDSHAELERLAQRLKEAREAGDDDAERSLRGEAQETSTRIDGFVSELERIGCVFKGAPQGLVDFYSYRNGRPVFLCWQFGEDELLYWHELDAGFAGRRPLATEALPGAT